MNDKKKDPRIGLNPIQIEMFNMLIDEGVSESTCKCLVQKYDYVYLEDAINKHKSKGMAVHEYLMFKVKVQCLTSKEKELFYRMETDFCVDQGDEYLAMLAVETYDTDNLTEIIAGHEKGSIDIVTLAEEHIIRKCKYKVAEVEADPETREALKEIPDCPF